MDRVRALLLWVSFAVALVILARGLPQRTFVVGDPGLKLIAARNAIEHPSRPFDIDLPRVAGKTVDLIDPSFSLHGDHAHAKTSELFPVLSAPLIAAFGIAGAYFLPGFGFLLALAAVAWIGKELDGRRSAAVLVFTAAACTPLLFYGLEFWEHAPAVGLAALATAVFIGRRSAAALVACGSALGVAVLLRPEAAWYCAGLAAGAWWLPSRPSRRHFVAVAAGIAVVWVPAMAASLLHFGQLLGGHVTGNMTGLSEYWWGDRVTTFRTWLVPANGTWNLAFLALPLAGIATLARPPVRQVASGAVTVLVAVAAVAAARGAFGHASVWNAAPAALLPMTAPWLSGRKGARFLAVVAATDLLLVLATAPNDGGSQWGPRYLLFAFIPLAVLTADVLTSAVGAPRVAGRLSLVRVVAIVAVVVIAASSVVVERNAYKNLRGGKNAYARLLEFVERETPADGYVVTDLWWFEQVTASLYPTRVVLFVDGGASARRALALVASASRVSVVRSEVESGRAPLGEWLEGTPFIAARSAKLQERALVVSELIHR